MGISEGKERKGTGNLFKQIVDKNFPNLWKELNPQIQEANKTSNYLNLKKKKPSPNHIVLKLSKINDGERLLQAAREKMTTHLAPSVVLAHYGLYSPASPYRSGSSPMHRCAHTCSCSGFL